MTKNKRNWCIVVGSIGILAIVTALFVLNSSEILRAIGVSKPVPVFVFNESKAPNWWAGENYNSKAAEAKWAGYQGQEPIDKLPVAGMTVLKGRNGDNATNCFVTFTYYDYQTNIAKLKAEKDAGTPGGDMKFQDVGDIQLNVSTPDGLKGYSLTKYELSGPGAESSMKGMGYGWIELNEGYIQVSAVCPTVAELDETAQISGAASLSNRSED